MAKTKKVPIAFPFVIEALENSRLGSSVNVRPMFGSHAVYLGHKIVFILRKKSDPKTKRDDGVWVCSPIEHVAALRTEFPTLRPIKMFEERGKKGIPTWLNLPETDADFEDTVLALCALAIKKDERVGKIPKPKPVRKGKPSR